MLTPDIGFVLEPHRGVEILAPATLLNLLLVVASQANSKDTLAQGSLEY